jgi:Mg2+ and Co2+ transporter CorA
VIRTFTDFGEFEKEARAMGVEEDLRALLTLDMLFVERYKDYTIINMRDYKLDPNNILILSHDKSLLYSMDEVEERDFRLYKEIFQKHFGESTALALVTARSVLENHAMQFEEFNEEIDELSEMEHPDLDRLSAVGKRLRKLTDKVEDFLDLLIKLEDRKIREVNTSYVSYDYHVLTAKARHLLDRCKSHQAQIMSLRSEYDIRTTTELNRRIERLQDVTKKLTGLALIFAIPMLIASFYGMNVGMKGLPPADWDHGFAWILVLTLVLTVAAYSYAKRRDWI